MKRAREKHEIVIGYKYTDAKRPSVNPRNKSVCNLSLAKLESVAVLSHMAVARACFHPKPEVDEQVINVHAKPLSNGPSAASSGVHVPPRTPFDSDNLES